MKGVVLAGGFGTRLRPLTYNIPKPMVPVVNIPVMEHNISLLKKYDITDLVVLLYYQSDIIKEYFGDGSKWGVNIKYHKAEADYGTAGAVKDSGHLIGKEDFIIISADVLTDFNLKNAIKYSTDTKAFFTIVLTSVKNPLDYGIVIFDKDQTITKFLEKPTWGQVFSDQINTGIYILRNKVLDEIPEKEFFDFSKDLFPKLMKKGIKIKAHLAKGYWRDIGNISEYRNSVNDILKGFVNISIHGKRLDILGLDVRCENGVSLAPNIKFGGTVIIGEGAALEEGVTIENSVIGRNVVIRKGAMVKNSVIWDGVQIDSKSRLHENIVGYNARIGRNVYVMEGAVLSDSCVLGDDVVVNSGVKIWPEKKVESGSTVDKSIVWGEKWNKNLFGNYGITGIANAEIHPELAAKLGSVYGAMIGKGKKVVVARDSHKASRMIARAFITGILSVGVNVDHFSEVPLPVIRYQLKMGTYRGAIFIRMSPIDKELMDIKFYDETGFDITADVGKNIERIFYREDYLRTGYREVGNIYYPHRIYEYYKEGFKDYLSAKDMEKKLSVVIDYTSGLAANAFPALMGKLVKNNTSLNASIDENREALDKVEYSFHVAQVSELVKTLKMDCGFVIDGCGESFVAVDERGNSYMNEKLLLLVAHIFMEYAGVKRMILPINAPQILFDRAQVKKIEVIKSPVTLKYLGKKAKEIESDFVGTIEGSFMLPKFNSAIDGMIVIGKLLQLMTQHGFKLNEMYKKLDYTAKYATAKLPCRDENKGEALRKLYDKFKNKDIEMIDGIKVRFSKKGWMSIIPDSEEGCFNITGEYWDKNEWQKFLKAVKEIIDNK